MRAKEFLDDYTIDDFNVFGRLKEIEILVEQSIGTTMTEDKAVDIYKITNELMSKVKNLNKKKCYIW